MKKILNKINEYKFYIIITIICFLLYKIQLPYYVLTPGGTINLNQRIEVETNEEIDGSMNLLYVNQYNATIPTYIMSYIFKNWDLEKVEEQQINDESVNEIYKRNQIMLDNSIQNAVLLAYNKAGKDINIIGKTNYVIATTTNNDFKVGDIVNKVDGIEINNVKEMQEIIRKKEIGELVEFNITRDNKNLTIESEITEQDGNKVVGIVILTNYEYTVNPDIEFKFKSSESGSSGGLMLALTIYDLISDEDLVKGRDIAGTGTIDIEGNVGEIAGIKYKIMGAVKNNIDIVLVPKDNYEEALKVKKDFNYNIEIVSIETFDDAINYLKEN